LCGNVDSFKTTFMVICNDNTTLRHFASTRYHGNNSLLSVMCVLCVIAQRLSMGWPAAEEKHRALVCDHLSLWARGRTGCHQNTPLRPTIRLLCCYGTYRLAMFCSLVLVTYSYLFLAFHHSEIALIILSLLYRIFYTIPGTD